MLHSCLREGTKVKTLTDLNCQILTSQNVPVLVERFINFIFEHGLESKGKLFPPLIQKCLVLNIKLSFF